MTAGDILFVDTNILLTATDEGRRDHELALSVFGLALENGIHLALSGQVVREYLVVATRPVAENGLGMKSVDAIANVREFRNRTLFLEEPEQVSRQLLSLVEELRISEKQVHDANIVATMLAHSIPVLVTENPQDFKRFASIETVGVRDLK